MDSETFIQAEIGHRTCLYCGTLNYVLDSHCKYCRCKIIEENEVLSE